ncbi:MAG TPA: periplasmic heavy metal sensor [Thermoanaerobaculia bacterium]|jgi:Spy/CpxP family protein refolding chaperone|nr:periplasmic heavy metal sensor [Thermoanaerobaculia bacterium]
MRSRKTNLILAFLIALLALPTLSGMTQAQQGRGPRDPREILRNPRALARYLQLTPAQVTVAQKLQADLKAQLEPLRANGKQLRDTLKAELDAAVPNACKVGDALLAVRANEDKIKDALEDFDQKFSALLTPEQLARYEALKEAARLLGGGEGS